MTRRLHILLILLLTTSSLFAFVSSPNVSNIAQRDLLKPIGTLHGTLEQRNQAMTDALGEMGEEVVRTRQLMTRAAKEVRLDYKSGKSGIDFAAFEDVFLELSEVKTGKGKLDKTRTIQQGSPNWFKRSMTKRFNEVNNRIVVIKKNLSLLNEGSNPLNAELKNLEKELIAIQESQSLFNAGKYKSYKRTVNIVNGNLQILKQEIVGRENFVFNKGKAIREESVSILDIDDYKLTNRQRILKEKSLDTFKENLIKKGYFYDEIADDIVHNLRTNRNVTTIPNKAGTIYYRDLPKKLNDTYNAKLSSARFTKLSKALPTGLLILDVALDVKDFYDVGVGFGNREINGSSAIIKISSLAGGLAASGVALNALSVPLTSLMGINPIAGIATTIVVGGGAYIVGTFTAGKIAKGGVSIYNSLTTPEQFNLYCSAISTKIESGYYVNI